MGLLQMNFTQAKTWDDWGSAVERREKMLAYYQAGGIIAVHMPIGNPRTKNGKNDGNFTDDDMVDAVTTGNQTNTNLNNWLQIWAIHKILNAGI